MLGRVVAPSPSVLAIGTAAESNGETRIRIATFPDNASERPAHAVFDGQLEIAGRRMVLSSVLGDRYIDNSFDNVLQRVRVWTDHESEPRDIYILVG